MLFNQTKTIVISFTYMLAVILQSCTGKTELPDASGTFETTETIISSEAGGTIRQLDVEEGMQLKARQQVGYIDTIQLSLKKKQLFAQIRATMSKKPVISTQLASLEEQMQGAERELVRVQKLVKAEAATQKQLDDATTQVAVLKKQAAALKSSLGISSEGISQDVMPLQVQVEQVNDQLEKCMIINPVEGTVLTKYAEPFETTMPGKPLYRIGNLDTMVLRVYMTGDQLAGTRLNQKVTVLADDGKGSFKKYTGTVTWISSKAEFTPKTIQTKSERANLVYAVKLTVQNDGYLKSGMYGEADF